MRSGPGVLTILSILLSGLVAGGVLTARSRLDAQRERAQLRGEDVQAERQLDERMRARLATLGGGEVALARLQADLRRGRPPAHRYAMHRSPQLPAFFEFEARVEALDGERVRLFVEAWPAPSRSQPSPRRARRELLARVSPARVEVLEVRESFPEGDPQR